MQKLIVRGIQQGEFKTRAEAIVVCFERGLVYDQHSRRRNQLLPWVKIEGTDETDHDLITSNLPIHPLDRVE